MNVRPFEKSLIDRVKDFRSSVHVKNVPWLGILLDDVVTELTRLQQVDSKADADTGGATDVLEGRAEDR